MDYEVVENPLHEGTYYIRLVQPEPDTLEELLPAIEGRTALSATDVEGVFDAIEAELHARLPHRPVDLGPLGSYALGVRGSLEDPDAPLPEDVEIHINVQADDDLEEDVARAVVLEKAERRVAEPIINYFLDIETQSRDQYTAANIGRLIGEHMKFDQSDDTQGVFFVAEDGAETRASTYSHVAGKRVEFLIPPDLTGPQRVVVRARFGADEKMRVSDPVGPLSAV
jgi:hypothetical protein